MAILNIHNVTGALLVLLAVVAIFWTPARRYVLYLLVLQIIIGAIVWASTKVAPPPAHWILAILGGGVYAMASAFERRGRPQGLVVGTLVLGALVFAYVYHLGQHAVGASGV